MEFDTIFHVRSIAGQIDKVIKYAKENKKTVGEVFTEYCERFIEDYKRDNNILEKHKHVWESATRNSLIKKDYSFYSKKKVITELKKIAKKENQLVGNLFGFILKLYHKEG